MENLIALCTNNDNKIICWDKKKNIYYEISQGGGSKSLAWSILGTTISVQILNHSSFISRLENSNNYINVNLIIIIILAGIWAIIRAINAFKAMHKLCTKDTVIKINVDDKFLDRVDKDNKLKIFSLCGWIPITWLVFQAYISTSNAYNLFICIAALQVLISFILTSQIISRLNFLKSRKN